MRFPSQCIRNLLVAIFALSSVFSAIVVEFCLFEVARAKPVFNRDRVWQTWTLYNAILVLFAWSIVMFARYHIRKAIALNEGKTFTEASDFLRKPRFTIQRLMMIVVVGALACIVARGWLTVTTAYVYSLF
jgi:hypothetical protein